MKRKRHALILEIIEKYNITTQDELLEKLSENGFDVTQATISRDIKELRLVKTMNASGQYCYSLNKSTTTDHSAKFHAIFKESVISINYAGNICSIKCYSGMAPAACAGSILIPISSNKRCASLIISASLINTLPTMLSLPVTTLNYRINRDKHYFIFSLTHIDGGYSDWGTYDVRNKYSIVYDIEDDCFCLEFDKSREGFHSDNKDILKLHEQLCSKKEEMIKIINQDF